MVTFVATNNLFFDIVSQQHDKRVALAASGWSSMRAYITVAQLEGGLFLIPVLTSSVPLGDPALSATAKVA